VHEGSLGFDTAVLKEERYKWRARVDVAMKREGRSEEKKEKVTGEEKTKK